MSDRVLVVTADDFGLSTGVNEGTLEAHERGIVTAASLMVRGVAADDAAARAAHHPELDVGLHLDLAEWEYIEFEWRPRYEVVDNADPQAVEAEIARQLIAFERLVGHPPTHIDSHQHVHRSEPVRSALARAGSRLGVPVRDLAPGIRYCGDFYGQDGRGEPVPEAITVAALVGIIERLPEGITELGCHPGLGPLDNVYERERQHEVRVLCDSMVSAALERHAIRLARFSQLTSA